MREQQRATGSHVAQRHAGQWKVVGSGQEDEEHLCATATDRVLAGPRARCGRTDLQGHGDGQEEVSRGVETPGPRQGRKRAHSHRCQPGTLGGRLDTALYPGLSLLRALCSRGLSIPPEGHGSPPQHLCSVLTRQLTPRTLLIALYLYFVLFLQKMFCYVVQVGLEFTVSHTGLKFRATLLPQPPKYGITGVCHHTQLTPFLLL